jgi:hypothetical protein
MSNVLITDMETSDASPTIHPKTGQRQTSTRTSNCRAHCCLMDPQAHRGQHTRCLLQMQPAHVIRYQPTPHATPVPHGRNRRLRPTRIRRHQATERAPEHQRLVVTTHSSRPYQLMPVGPTTVSCQPLTRSSSFIRSICSRVIHGAMVMMARRAASWKFLAVTYPPWTARVSIANLIR